MTCISCLVQLQESGVASVRLDSTFVECCSIPPRNQASALAGVCQAPHVGEAAGPVRLAVLSVSTKAHTFCNEHITWLYYEAGLLQCMHSWTYVQLCLFCWYCGQLDSVHLTVAQMWHTACRVPTSPGCLSCDAVHLLSLQCHVWCYGLWCYTSAHVLRGSQLAL